MTKHISITVYAAMCYVFQTTGRANQSNWSSKLEFSSFAVGTVGHFLRDLLINGIDLLRFKVEPCFGDWLSMTGDYLLNYKSSPLPIEEKEKLERWLDERKLTHFSCHSIFRLPENKIGTVLLINNGFLAVINAKKELKVLNVEEDGSVGEQKTFDATRVVRGVSPDKEYLIITQDKSSVVELYDTTTLELSKQYNCPMDHVDSCHIFGDVQQWYIVVKADSDTNIYILNGLNGELDRGIQVDDGDEVAAVSQCGHILIMRPTKMKDPNNTVYGNLQTIHFRNPDNKTAYQSGYVEGLFIYHQLRWCMFSDDGNFLAVYDSENKQVSVFRTNHGTVYRVFKAPRFFDYQIIFICSSCLIVKHNARTLDETVLVSYDLERNKWNYSSHTSMDYFFKPLAVSQNTEKFIPVLYGVTDDCELVKLEFHRLEENILANSG